MKYKVNELAKLLGVTTMTLRRYEKYGYIAPERDDSDYRLYNTSDISRIAQIRQLRRCGFSHEMISAMLGGTQPELAQTSLTRLDELDAEIARLKNLRHWLKDNIKLIDTVYNLQDSFTMMECPPMRYVLYSNGDKLLTERKRLKTIQDFMIAAEEVQLIQVYKLDDLAKGIYAPRRGWAIKEVDVSRFNLDSVVADNEYVHTYPKMECLYGSILIPAAYMNDMEKRADYIKEFNVRKDAFLKEHKLEHAGDVVCFLVDMLGEMNSVLVCMPVKPVV